MAKLLDEGPYLSPVAVQQLQAIKNSWGVMMTGSLALFLALHSLSCGWLCMDNMVALTLAEAAGWGGRQNWSLVLSSSPRVSRVTYDAVIAVRYPELDEEVALWDLSC